MKKMKFTEVGFFNKWGRRSLIIPAYYLMTISLVALSPALYLFTFINDAIRKNRWSFSRCLSFLYVYLIAECVSVFIAFIQWILVGGFLGLGKNRLREWTFTLQALWGKTLVHGAFRIFGIHMYVEGSEEIKKGPLILFIRHASLPDVSLPGYLFNVQRKIRLRHVIKRELLWDPSLDVGGNRIPSFFVRRGSEDSEKEIEGVRRLMEGIAENEGVMIYPEGTRFTPSKRRRIMEKLAQKKDNYLLEKAMALKNVLPPRLGGSLAILEKNICGYAVFCAHVGFEATTKMWDMLNGSLIDKTIRVRLWKIPFEEIPKTREAQIEWLYEKWFMVDNWIERHKNLDQILGENPNPA